jgi:hypothetical protein
MKFVSIPYNDFIYEIFIYEMLCEIFVRGGGPQAPQFNPTIQPPMVCGLPQTPPQHLAYHLPPIFRIFS